jgi:hypothetical protein
MKVLQPEFTHFLAAERSVARFVSVILFDRLLTAI